MCERERRSFCESVTEISIPPPSHSFRPSVMIFGISVLIARLAIMAGLAKSLPVVFIPHQMRITTVRNDMVDHGRCVNRPCALQTHTQRMPAEVRLAEPLPLAAVSTLSGRRSVWVQWLMLCTVQTVCQIGTAWVLAWFQCLPRHKVHLRIQQKPMWNTTGLSVSFL